MTIDNIKGKKPIYWIANIAPFHGTTDVGQITESGFDMVEYTDEEVWKSDLELLGFEMPEEDEGESK